MSLYLPTNIVDPQGFQDTLQEWMVGITDYESEKVRPRWQINPPPRPALDQDWLAFGVTSTIAESSAYQDESPREPSDAPATLRWVEELTILLSFYGLSAPEEAAKFRDTAQYEPNRYPLTRAGINIIGFSEIAPMNELVNERYILRADMQMRVRRVSYREFVPTEAKKIRVVADLGSSANISTTIEVTTNAKP